MFNMDYVLYVYAKKMRKEIGLLGDTFQNLTVVN